jgi:cell division septation protein DedD
LGSQIREQAMAKIEPNTFRAQDRVPAFDDMEEDDEEEGSRLPLLIVIALLVLAAFGGVVWLAYNQGVQKGRADAPRPLIAEAQSSRSGNGALKVYEQPAPPDQDSGDADTVPQPPTETKPAPSVAAAPPVAQATAPATEVPTPKPAPVVQAAPKPVVTTSKPAPSTTLTAQTATKPPQQLVTPKPKPVEAAPVATPTSSPAATTGDYVLQIGAYKSEDEAKSAWKSYQGKHPMLGGYESDVKQVDLADKGTWYRLRVGAFPTKDAASTLCTKLKADGGDCLLAKK